MRSWMVDQFEFPNPGSEEELEVNAATRSPFPCPDVVSFVSQTIGSRSFPLPAPVPFDERYGFRVREYLAYFTGLELPTPCNWLMYVLTEGHYESHLVLVGDDRFVRYRWSTSA